jgi:hypothetical protein
MGSQVGSGGVGVGSGGSRSDEGGKVLGGEVRSS